MTDFLPEALEPFPEISAKAYEHPADRAATAALKAVPMLDTVVRKLVEFRYERALRQFYLGNSVKVSERQLPGLWTSHQGVVRILDLDHTPALYVAGQMELNAQTIGSKDPMIVMDSALLSLLGPGEQRAILAHELGHILSDHVLYMTALNILLRGVNLPGMIGMPLRAVRAVLLEWMRAAELSCDRAATLAVRDPQIVCRALMTVTSGMPASELDLDAFMAQAMEYENWEDGHDRVRRFFLELGVTHSFAVRRVSEVMRWVQGGEYDRILRGEYRRRGEETDVREEAGEAMEFYAERFRALFRELGENVTNLGSQVGDVSQQVADWLRQRGSRD
ncbi:MAG TPA: M48 family metallopeptidase [Solirubrobacteraceae bacterium]|nr:M48 family metallopeptidase [Solirubrobacteraceae bacterium]